MRFLKCGAAFIAFLAAGMGAAYAAGDPVKGKDVFDACSVCHVAEKGDGNGIGPNLFGIVGRKAASLPDFTYSDALKHSGIVWTDDKIAVWVRAPAKLVPGTKMSFPGLPNPKDVSNVVAYLNTLK